MSNVNVYTVYDQKSETANAPFFLKNDALAIRGFSQAVENNKDTDLHKFPEDFVLKRIGTYNLETGIITGEEHKIVALAHDFKN